MLHYPKLHQSACWIETSSCLATPALRNSTTTAASPQQLHPLLLHQHTARHPSSLFSFFLFSEKKENKKKNRSSTAQPTKSCRVTTLKMPSAASNKDTTLTSPSMLAQGNWIFTPLTTARHDSTMHQESTSPRRQRCPQMLPSGLSS